MLRDRHVLPALHLGDHDLDDAHAGGVHEPRQDVHDLVVVEVDHIGNILVPALAQENGGTQPGGSEERLGGHVAKGEAQADGDIEIPRVDLIKQLGWETPPLQAGECQREAVQLPGHHGRLDRHHSVEAQHHTWPREGQPALEPLEIVVHLALQKSTGGFHVGHGLPGVIFLSAFLFLLLIVIATPHGEVR